jgi:hypothetical protein
MERSPHHPTPSAKNETGDFGRFKEFMRKLVQVPHSEIKARIEANREAKRTSNVSRDSGASSKRT